MRECVSKLLKWINWEYVVIALGFILLGYVIGIIGFGAEFDLSDWITSISSIVVAIVAIQGLSAYKKQYHYSTAKIAAENLIKMNFSDSVFDMNERFQAIWWLLTQINHVYHSNNEEKLSLKPIYLEMKQHLDYISQQREKIVISEYDYLKLRSEFPVIYENIVNFKLELDSEITKVLSKFTEVKLVKEDSDIPKLKSITRLIIHRVGDINGDMYGEDFIKRNDIRSMYRPFGDPNEIQKNIQHKLFQVLADN